MASRLQQMGCQRQCCFNFAFLLVFLVAFLAACALQIATPVAAAENLRTPPAVIAQLEALKKLTGVGAAAYALVENNTIIATGGMGTYGITNPRPVTEASMFRIGSITKTFTALAVMHLVEQGKLQLDQDIKSLDPGLPLHNPWPATPVTLAMLLEHTAGLQDLSREEFDTPDPLSLRTAINLKPETRRLHWPPGYHYSYTNLGAGYAGLAIEAVTKEDYDDWFEREILAATGMDDSQLHWTKQLERSLVTGYDSDLKTEIPYWHTLFRPFGGLNTTARDMAKFLLIFTDVTRPGKNIVSAAAIKRMETPGTSLAARAGLTTGYGLGIRNRYFNGHRIYGHGGDADGYLAEYAYSQESHRGYFIVINAFRHDMLEKFTERLNTWLIEDLQATPVSKDAGSEPGDKPVSGATLQALSGDYREITFRFPFQKTSQAEIVRIKFIDNALFKCIENTDNCTKLVPVTENLFHTEAEPGASMAFIRAADGNLYLQASFGNYQKISAH